MIAVDVEGAARTFAINCAAGGLSGAVDEALDADLKAR